MPTKYPSQPVGNQLENESLLRNFVDFFILIFNNMPMKKLSSRKRPSTIISSIMKKPNAPRVSSKQDLVMAVRALEKDDPHSILALVAKWRLRSLIANEGADEKSINAINKVIDKMPKEQARLLFMITMANVIDGCAKELEDILEKRGFINEI